MDSLQQLYEYTVFHIGLYFTIAGGVVAYLNLEIFSKGVDRRTQAGLLASIFLLIVSGAFGSLVASSISRTEQELGDFLIADIGPLWRPNMIRASSAMMLEHIMFWAAIAVLFVTIVGSSLRQHRS